MRRSFILAAMLFALLSTSFAQVPATLPLKPAQQTGNLAIRTYLQSDYFFVAGQATHTTMGDTMKRIVPELLDSVKQAGFVPVSPIVVVMHGVGPDPKATFDFEVGFMVPANTKAGGTGEVGKLEALTCASVVYSGKTTEVGKAYESLYGSILASGKQPTQEVRQMILFYEGEESVNNIMLLQVGVQ
jgi:DNA gyrase inhibitor GyrI